MVSGLKLPIAAAHILIYEPSPDDGVSWDKIPTKWQAPNGTLNLHFESVDVLYISPFIVDPNGHFVLETLVDGKPVDLKPRLQWIIQTARHKNPNVKLFAQQFYGDTGINTLQHLPTVSGQSPFDAYANSVPVTLRTFGLDGYDLDYEWHDKKIKGKWVRLDGNIIPEAPHLLAKIREVLDKETAHEYYVSISPATTARLVNKSVARWPSNSAADTFPVAKSVHLVNIQSYAGGQDPDNANGVEAWLGPLGGGLSLSASQVLFGICSENNSQSPNISQAEAAYNKPLPTSAAGQTLAGIHNWRLNSENLPYENEVQSLLFNILHRKPIDPTSRKRTEERWESRGM